MHAKPDDKSRSQIKRDIAALKELGIRLAGLSKGQLQTIPLSDKTRAAVLEAQRLERNALSRQYKYISALLGAEDADAIRAALAGALQPHADEVAKLHEAERWRDRLLSAEEGGLAAFVERYPACDRARVQLLVSNAQKEAEHGKPPKSARELLRYVRAL